MVLDIIIAVILIAFMIYGLRKGFFFTFIHTVGWVIAVVAGLFCTPYVKKFLADKTGMYDFFYDDFQSRFSGSDLGIDSSMETMPSVLGDGLNSFTTNIIDGIASTFANIVLTVFTFIAIMIVVKIILWLLLRLLSKDFNDGVRGFFDGFFGLLAGFFKGALIVFVFLALMLPVTNLVSPDTTQLIVDNLDNSLFAQDLYNNNFIMIILEGFFD